MRVAVVGVGGVGRILALELASDPRVRGLVLADKDVERANPLKNLERKVPTEVLACDASEPRSLARVIAGADVVVNASLPRFNFGIMAACLDAGSHYVDLAATGPRPGGTWGVLEQLGHDAEWRSRGRAALLGMGLDPGLSNVIARRAADRLDAVREVRIRSGGTARLPGYEGFPLYSRETFLEDALLPPTVWEGGRLVEVPPLTGGEDYPFPDPVGVQRVFHFSHEEVKTIPLHLGKPVGRVDFKYALNADLVQAVLSLHRLGLLDPARTVTLGGRAVPFRNAFLSAFPEPSTLVAPLEGAKSLAVEVLGERGGEPVTIRGTVTMSHADANRKRGTTATYFLTAAVAACGATLLGSGGAGRTGVFPPEALGPEAILHALEGKGVRVEFSETPAA